MRKPRLEWLPQHTAKMIELHAHGCTDDVIAGATGHDIETVRRRRDCLGLAPNYRNQISDFTSLPALSRRAIAAACGMIPT